MTLKQQGFYCRAAWRKTRKMVLQRDHYLCQHCLAEGRVTPATEVHHIKKLEDYPDLALDLSNLVSLCWTCHELTKDRNLQLNWRKRAVLKDASARVRIIADHPPRPSDFL